MWKEKKFGCSRRLLNNFFGEGGYNPIDFERVISNPLNQEGKFYISCSSAIDGSPIIFSEFEEEEPLREILYATTHIPLLFGTKPIEIKPEILEKCRIRTNSDNSPDTPLYVFDGSFCNFENSKTSEIIPNQNATLLTISNKSKEEIMRTRSFYGLPKSLFGLEEALMRSFFRDFPEFYTAYMHHHTNEDEITLSREDIHPERRIRIKSSNLEEELKNAAMKGWDLASMKFDSGKNVGSFPRSWQL